MDKQKRAVRRHHERRLKKKFAKLIERYEYFTTEVPTNWTKVDRRRLGMQYHSPQLCSCMGCGNSRKYEGDKVTDKSLLQLLKSEY